MFSVFYTLTQTRISGPNWSLAGDICYFTQNKMKKKSLKPEGQMLSGVVYRLIESLASMEYSFIWKLICAFSVCNTLTVVVLLSSTPSISGPGSTTVNTNPSVSLALPSQFTHHTGHQCLEEGMTTFWQKNIQMHRRFKPQLHQSVW